MLIAQVVQLPLMLDLRELGVELTAHSLIALFVNFHVRTVLVDHVLEVQLLNP